jgi:hypothetical protein
MFCLSFNPQPQNRVFRVPNQFKPSVLPPPLSGLLGCFSLRGATSASPMWHPHMSLSPFSLPRFFFSPALSLSPPRLGLASSAGPQPPTDARRRAPPPSPSLPARQPCNSSPPSPFLAGGGGAGIWDVDDIELHGCPARLRWRRGRRHPPSSSTAAAGLLP